MGNTFIFGELHENSSFPENHPKIFDCQGEIDKILPNYKLYENLHPSEIRQGKLDNNYFIYALAALAEKSCRI